MADHTDTPEGVAWLNPNDPPGGVRVTYWALDDDGPNELPVVLETAGSYTELTRGDAARIGRALLGAAGEMPGLAPVARERLARHLWLDSRPGDPYAQAHWDHGGDQHVNKAAWRAKADAVLAVITGTEN